MLTAFATACLFFRSTGLQTSPPDADTFINSAQVPNYVQNPEDEVWLHNSAVTQRGIQRRQRAKLAQLSSSPARSLPDVNDNVVRHANDSATPAATITYVCTFFTWAVILTYLMHKQIA